MTGSDNANVTRLLLECFSKKFFESVGILDTLKLGVKLIIVNGCRGFWGKVSRASRYVALSLPRLWMRDVLHFGMKSMVVGGATSIQVARVAEVRRRHQPLISWSAILIKAIALVAKERPDLRRAYMPFPWAHLYEHPHNVATVVLEREWRNEPAVFFDQIQQPEKKSLREIDYELRGMKRAKIEALGGYRRIIRITRYPLLLRRLLWRIGLQGSGRLRAKYFGTFAINSMVSRRVLTTQSTTPITLSIFYGPIYPNGEMPLQIFFDHRVIDGSSVNRISLGIQAVLNREIVAELTMDPTTSQANNFACADEVIE